jgi:class 3 adenylate cyclase/tetratricopeptide (TPR) repeat protein
MADQTAPNRTRSPGITPSATPGGDTRAYVAVLFSDLCQSTRLAAELDADAYSELLQAIRARAADIITSAEGQIAQVYGDGLLSVFQGANAAVRAIEAASRLHAAVTRMPPPPGASVPALRLHSGLHSGLVLLRAGDPARGTVEAVGRTTSVAARLSAAARPDEILASAGSIGPARQRLASGEARPITIGEGAEPVLALPVRVPEGGTIVSDRDGFPFIGRTALLERLVGQACNPASPLRLLIEAPPGMGKSRLAREIGARARASGADVGYRSFSAFAAVGPLQLIRQVPGLTDAAVPGEGSPEQFLADLAARSAHAPTLLILDDWQWADSASAVLLARILDFEAPVGLLLLCREGEAAPPLEDRFETLRLPPLGEDETARLAQSRHPGIDPIEATRIHLRAGGNPLFVEELCALSAANLPARPPSGAEPAGAGWISSLVGARIQALPPEARRLLDAAAVAGMQAPLALLEQMIGPEVLAQALPLLFDRDLLLPDALPGRYRFKHGITWEVAYSLVPLATRRALHGQIAAFLASEPDESDPDRPAALAWHCLASDQLDPGWRHAESAGDRAAEAGSLDLAQRHYRMAVDALLRLPPEQVDPLRLRKLVGRLGHSCIYDADASQVPVFDQVLARARADRDWQAEAEALYWRAFIRHGSGLNRDAAHDLEAALACWQGPADQPLPVQMRATLGAVRMQALRYAEAVPLLDEAVQVKRAFRSGRNTSPGAAYSLSMRAAISADTGDFAAARDMLAEAELMVTSTLHPVGASVLSWAAAVLAWQGDWEELVDTAARGRDIARRVEAIQIHASMRALESYGRFHQGECDPAIDALAEAVACKAERGSELALEMFAGYLAEAEAARGREPACLAAAALAYTRARQGNPLGVASAALARARLEADRHPDRARAHVRTARRNGERRRSPHVAARCDLAELQLGLCPPADRNRLADRAAAAFMAMNMPNLLAELQAVSRA